MRGTTFALSLLLLAGASGATETAVTPSIVTVDNFVRAETDVTFARTVAEGALGTLRHTREMTAVEHQKIIRMNRDTLYSSGVFDLATPVIIHKPDPGQRFQSMLVISQDHSMLPVEHGGGTFELTQARVGTRYAMVVFRTFANPDDSQDMAAAHALQDRNQDRAGLGGRVRGPCLGRGVAREDPRCDQRARGEPHQHDTAVRRQGEAQSARPPDGYGLRLGR